MPIDISGSSVRGIQEVGKGTWGTNGLISIACTFPRYNPIERLGYWYVLGSTVANGVGVVVLDSGLLVFPGTRSIYSSVWRTGLPSAQVLVFWNIPGISWRCTTA